MAQKRPPFRRFAHIDRRLRQDPPPTASNLASELQVTPRTIYRDIDYMRFSLGAAIVVDARGGYRYQDPSFRLPPITFSEGELLALFLAERTFRQYRGTPYESDIARLLRKLVAFLPEEISIDLEQLDGLYSFRPVATSVQDIETFRALSDAVLRRRRVRIAYYTASRDVEGERELDPYHLANVGGEWYLFAFCHRRQDVAVFRPDRIRSIHLTRHTFERPLGFSAAQRLDTAFGVVHDEGRLLRVVLDFDEFAARFIREKVWHASQELTPRRGGGLRMVVRLSSLVEIRRFALSWGEHCRAVAPKALVDDLRATVATLAEVYS